MIVLDASAAISMIRGDDESSEDSIFGRFLELDEKVIAPEFFCVEATNVAWKHVHAKELDSPNAVELAKTAIGCVDEFADNGSLLTETLDEAARLDHPVYDMLYLVLARRQSARLVTCDKRLAKLCLENGVDCSMLIDL